MSTPVASPDSSREELRRRNLRLGLILAAVVAVFFVGFVAKIILTSHH
jgi:hypothetical protein